MASVASVTVSGDSGSQCDTDYAAEEKKHEDQETIHLSVYLCLCGN